MLWAELSKKAWDSRLQYEVLLLSMMVMRFGLAIVKGRGELGLGILDDLEAVMYRPVHAVWYFKQARGKKYKPVEAIGYHLKDMARHSSILHTYM